MLDPKMTRGSFPWQPKETTNGNPKHLKHYSSSSTSSTSSRSLTEENSVDLGKHVIPEIKDPTPPTGYVIRKLITVKAILTYIYDNHTLS